MQECSVDNLNVTIKDSIRKIDDLLEELAKKDADLDSTIQQRLDSILEGQYPDIPKGSAVALKLKNDLVDKYRHVVEEKISDLKQAKRCLMDIL